MDCFGAVVVPLNEGQAEEAIGELLAEDVEAIAICFLWSFLEPAHERRARDIVRDLAPGLFVTCSHELVPKWGEYERTTASCLNAYVGPVTTSYLADIEERLGMDVDACAAGISQIVEFQMADLIHKATIQKGFDPRDFVVFAFGGAGPAHAGVFATELGVSKVVIPQRATASVWCAFGAASVDLLHIYERVDIMATPFDLERVNALLASLCGQAEAQLLADGMPRERHRFRYALDMRHKGQIHEVEVGLDEMPVGRPEFDGLPERFTALYERLYGSGSSLSGARLEIVTARCRASAATRKPSFVRHEELTSDIPPEARLARRSVYWPRIAGAGAGIGTGNGTASAAAAAGDALPGRVDTPVYDGHRLVPGNGLEGPAIVELDTTTVVVHPRQALRMDAYGNFELFPEPARSGGGAVEHRAERPAAAGATVAAG